MKVGVVGLGLIGGSLAKSIKARTLHTVYGIDKDKETMTLARLCGAIDAPLDEAHIGACDLLLVSICPQAAVDWVAAEAERIPKGAILVDMCGVKRAVCAKLAPIASRCGFHYIGGHPMAGRERGGFVSSLDNLFAGASMILTPDAHTDMYMLETLKKFFIDIGFANLAFATPEDHDRRIAYTSQLAHILSSAYVKSPEAQEHRGFSAGSFNDMTRVARLDEEMWTELFLDNADNLCEQLGILMENLGAYKKAIDARDEAGLKALLREGREQKAKAGGC